MRIISGIYGRRRFAVPSTFNARPTTDFAKENIFNVLSNLTDWEGLDALDLFSGTGSISFELLSRGCRQVTAVENHRAHVSFIAKAAKELGTDGLNLICGDAFRFLHTCRNRTFGFVFADPPYALKELADVPPLVLGNGSPESSGVLMDGGIFVMEHSATYDFSHLPGFRQRRAYGSVHFSIFIKEAEKTGA